MEDYHFTKRFFWCDTPDSKRLVNKMHNYWARSRSMGDYHFTKMSVWYDTTVVASPWPTPGKVTKLATKATMNCHERGKYKYK